MYNFEVKIEWDEARIRNKAEALLDDNTRTQINQAFAEIIEPWTPYWHGPLSQNITVDATGVTYNVPYAREQYYHSIAFHKDVHPLATREWDKVAMQSEMENFEAKVKEILVERAKQIYG